MMVECNILNFTFIWKLSMLFIFVLCANSFNFKCPSQSSWNFRAQEKCNRTFEYFCLYNNVIEEYIEGCKGPDWDRKGNKRIYVGYFSREKCILQRFQPFIFWTNGSTSDCIYSKSICTDQGQIVYKDNSTKDDRACRCDHTKNYSFIKKPRNVCFCIPSEEDCSCYVKSCSSSLKLSTDYRCIQRSLPEKPVCTDKTKYENTPEIKREFVMEIFPSKKTPKPNWSNSAGVTTLVIFILDVCYCIAAKEQEDIEIHQSDDTITTDDVRILRLFHLLFRVACPVVRMTFNKEIQPIQLREKLDKCKKDLEDQYRKTDAIINNIQWDLLFKHDKGETVTSDDFDIRLLIYLLRTLANFEVGDLYPVQCDKRVSAMLSRIKFIRNEITQSFEGKVSEDQFNQYWDDIVQALLKLMSSYEFNIENDQEKARLIDRLLAMNPIHIDNKRLRMFIDMSERYPATILNKLISEYCTFKNITMERLLLREQHDIYHKRIGTAICCRCPAKYSKYTQIISNEHWEALYELKKDGASRSCRCSQNDCIDNFVPKKTKTFDLPVTKVLILNIPDILFYMIDRLCENRFDKFLMHNQHEIYHYMEEKRCCKCNNMYRAQTEKQLINQREWRKMYTKKDNACCNTDVMDCSCQYAVRNGVEYKNIDDMLLCKIFDVAGPIGDLNKIEENAFLGFLSYTVDDKPLQKTLKTLCAMIKDETFCIDKSKCYSSCDQSDENDACRLISRHLLQQKNTLEAIGFYTKKNVTKFDTFQTDEKPSHQIFVREKDGLNVKCIYIPEDLPLPQMIRKITDITPEENYFLVVVHALTKIVYPVIKHQLSKQCPEDVFDKIRKNIYEEQTAQFKRDSLKRRSSKKRIYLTQNKKEQLFSVNKKESKHLDLKLMLYILKKKFEEEGKRKFVEQIEVIDNIRRNIVQSSSGVLNETRFQDILLGIRKAVLFLGGEFSEKQLSDLQHIHNILDLSLKINSNVTSSSDS
ncbi:unnamed protein product [Mytilus coruscus]|uniref:DZIP3-like HEPN domain-containing protein n=1 Tax=Mytilus coruscus TaxID=42192 RepID=A0A6J8A2E5_MYTCO|nr:unnamed protein product [Mytilus coruscus]